MIRLLKPIRYLLAKNKIHPVPLASTSNFSLIGASVNPTNQISWGHFKINDNDALTSLDTYIWVSLKTFHLRFIIYSGNARVPAKSIWRGLYIPLPLISQANPNSLYIHWLLKLRVEAPTPHPLLSLSVDLALNSRYVWVSYNQFYLQWYTFNFKSRSMLNFIDFVFSSDLKQWV